jgi:hypothetical protein
MTLDADGDLPFDHESAARIAEAFGNASPKATEIVRDHVEYYDEVLPTILLAEIGRWFASTASDPDGPDGREAARAVRAVSDLYECGNESMRNIVATGLLEALPQPHEDGREVVERLPPALRDELRRMENWTPS